MGGVKNHTKDLKLHLLQNQRELLPEGFSTSSVYTGENTDLHCVCMHMGGRGKGVPKYAYAFILGYICSLFLTYTGDL